MENLNTDIIDESMFEDVLTTDDIKSDIVVEEENPQVLVDDEPSEDKELASILFNSYKDRGFVNETDEDKFDGTFEWIEKSLDELPNKIQDELINSVAPIGKDILDFVLSSGQNLTKESLEDFMSKHISQESLSVETIDEAREYLEEVYKKKGMRANAIIAQLDDLEESEELLTIAKQEIEKEKTKTQELISKSKELSKEQKANQEIFNNKITENILALPKTRQALVLETSKNAQSLIGQIASDPQSYVQLMNLLSYYKDGKFDLSVFEKQAESSANSKLKDKILASGIRSSTKGGSSNTILDTQNFELVV